MTEEQKQKARERAKRYYQKNKAKILARQKEYCKMRYHSDDDYRKRILERGKNYRENNLEKFREIRNKSQKKHYNEHRDYYREYNKKWYQTHISSYKNKNITIKLLKEKINIAADILKHHDHNYEDAVYSALEVLQGENNANK